MKLTFRAVTLAFFCVWSGTLSAASLSDLTNGVGTLTIGDKVFGHFGWSGDVDPAGITITTIGNGSANNLYGIDINFNGNFTATGGLTDGDLTYSVTTIGPQLISDMHSTVNVTGIGFVIVSEFASDQRDQSTSSFVVPLLIAEPFVGPDQFTATADVPPSGTVWINKDIELSGTGQINDIEQRFSQVPDGGSTLALLGLALAGIGSWRWRHLR